MKIKPISFKVYHKEDKNIYDVRSIDYISNRVYINKEGKLPEILMFNEVEFKPIVGKDYFGIDVSLHDMVLNSPIFEEDLGIVVYSKKYNCFGVVWSKYIEDGKTIDDLIHFGVDFSNYEVFEDFRIKNEKIMNNENLRERYEKIIEFLKDEKMNQIKNFLEEKVFEFFCNTIGYDKFIIFNDRELIIKDIKVDDTYQYIVYFTAVINVDQKNIELYMLYNFEKEEFALVYEDFDPTYENEEDFLNALWVYIFVNYSSIVEGKN